MEKTNIWNKIVLISIIGFFLAGCATVGSTKIVMNYDKYTPSFRASAYRYLKGKRVVLANFHNQAQNTKTWGYYSADNKYMYESNAHLESYYWYCFKKAFRHIGVRVVEYQVDKRYRHRHYRHHYWWGAPGPDGYVAPRGVPEFQLILTSMTDQEFKFKVLIFKNGETRLDKTYTVTMSPAGTDQVPQLEKRAYRLVDLAFTTIMKDRAFRKAF